MCLDLLRLPNYARNPHFSAERHVNTLLSRSLPSGRVGGITGGIRALVMSKNSMYLVKWTFSLLLSRQKELSDPWFCNRCILSITSRCRLVNVKMEKLATASPEWEVEPRIE
ncbi:hypothetical protein M9H77_06957 [Catharanthus roseus]|uniref:Uncharacterized protein n=1 Tax=Catharanthus roseus TaxID=4058 RepID=A0ACC0BTT8_CATRO|nr:hypothetical protein M9H77_06957 [Catharanthus roseus]